MAELDKEIAELKARVAKYETELDAATTAEEKQRISSLINSRSETLNRLLDEKKALSRDFDPVQAFADVLGQPVDYTLAALIRNDPDLVTNLRYNRLDRSTARKILKSFRNIVTSITARTFMTREQYLFDGLIGVPSKQESTCLQYVIEGSRLRVAKISSSSADIKREEEALRRICNHHIHCPTVVPLLNAVQVDEHRFCLILPHYGLSVAQLNGAGVSLMVSLHANVAMCGLATIIACNNVGLCHGDIKPSNMMFTDSGVIVTIDFGVTCAYNTLNRGGTNYFGMDALPATLQYDLACLASSLLTLAEVDISEHTMATVQNNYENSHVLARRLAALLVSSSGDLDALWAACKDTIEQMTTNKEKLLVYDNLKPIARDQTSV